MYVRIDASFELIVVMVLTEPYSFLCICRTNKNFITICLFNWKIHYYYLLFARGLFSESASILLSNLLHVYSLRSDFLRTNFNNASGLIFHFQLFRLPFYRSTGYTTKLSFRKTWLSIFIWQAFTHLRIHDFVLYRISIKWNSFRNKQIKFIVLFLRIVSILLNCSA